jgi:hypothetical protein
MYISYQAKPLDIVYCKDAELCQMAYGKKPVPETHRVASLVC